VNEEQESEAAQLVEFEAVFGDVCLLDDLIDER
jgi:hypothetical protein